MDALPLIDLAISRSSLSEREADDSPAILRMVGWATKLAESVLRSLETLRAVDDDLGNNRQGSFDREAAELLHAAYEKWAQSAGSLMSRIERIERRGGRVTVASELRDAHGRVSAMLQVTLDDVDEADSELRQGRRYTIEEVRNELHAGVRTEGIKPIEDSRSMASGRNAGRDRVAG